MSSGVILATAIEWTGGSFSIKEDVNDKGLVSLYPNPATNYISLNSEEKITSVKIFNSMGQVVLETSKSNQNEISRLAAGAYQIQVYMASNRLADFF